jgi:hypothetical protein
MSVRYNGWNNQGAVESTGGKGCALEGKELVGDPRKGHVGEVFGVGVEEGECRLYGCWGEREGWVLVVGRNAYDVFEIVFEIIEGRGRREVEFKGCVEYPGREEDDGEEGNEGAVAEATTVAPSSVLRVLCAMVVVEGVFMLRENVLLHLGRGDMYYVCRYNVAVDVCLYI